MIALRPRDLSASPSPSRCVTAPIRLSNNFGNDCSWPILLQKSFCTPDQKFSGPWARLSCKDSGTSSPAGKLAVDLGNAIEATRIDDRRSDCPAAGKLSLGDFRLLQQYRPPAERRLRKSSPGQVVPALRGIGGTACREGDRAAPLICCGDLPVSVARAPVLPPGMNSAGGTCPAVARRSSVGNPSARLGNFPIG